MTDTSNGDPRTAMAQRRTGLATFRTAQSLDRTTLAWVRTTLTMGSFGFGLIGFFRAIREKNPTPEAISIHQAAIRFGEILVLLGISATVLAGISHWKAIHRMERGEIPKPARWPLSVVIAFFLAVLGMAGLWSLITGR